MDKEYTYEEIRELAIKRYGNHPHLWGGQRDGFVEGFKQALSITEPTETCEHDYSDGTGTGYNV